jgi:HD-GYP domain-containing protein (c-di-GMP phosphodiesterase class II)
VADNQVNEIEIPVKQLKLGMHVIRLDRPWLDTDFSLQGFVIKSPEQIKRLATQCQFVVIHKSSVQSFNYHERRIKRKGLFARLFKKNKPSIKGKKTAIYNHIAKAPPPPEKRIIYTDQVGTGQELSTAKITYHEAKTSVNNLMENIRIGRSANVLESSQAVDHIVDSVIRNQDALRWLTKIKHQDAYTAEHSINVCILSATFARFLGHDEGEIRKIAISGLLHDVGKSRVPVDILNKNGRLTIDELNIMKEHTTFGKDLLLSIGHADRIAVDVAHTHHERLDGKGYPRGLTASQIPYYAKIIALADCYDAITSSRCYDAARASMEALDIIYKCRGVQFDNDLAIDFIKCIGIYPPGAIVELNSGHIGIVISSNPGNKLRPKVLLVRNKDKKIISEKPVDLTSVEFQGKIKISRELPDGSYDVHSRDYLSMGSIMDIMRNES